MQSVAQPSSNGNGSWGASKIYKVALRLWMVSGLVGERARCSKADRAEASVLSGGLSLSLLLGAAKPAKPAAKPCVDNSTFALDGRASKRHKSQSKRHKRQEVSGSLHTLINTCHQQMIQLRHRPIGAHRRSLIWIPPAVDVPKANLPYRPR